MAQTLTSSSSDQAQLAPLLDGIRANLGTRSRRSIGRRRLLLRRQSSTTNGGASRATSHRKAGTIKRRRIEGYIATGRQKHGTKSATAKKASRPVSLIARMSTKLKRAGYRSRYRLRKQIVRTRLRTDQTGKRVQAIPAARHRKGKRRMGTHLHRSQPRQAGKGRLSRHHQDKTAFPKLTGQLPKRGDYKERTFGARHDRSREAASSWSDAMAKALQGRT